MDRAPEIQRLNSAWENNEINFQERNIGAEVIYASYDG
jgi:hypothetical protein